MLSLITNSSEVLGFTQTNEEFEVDAYHNYKFFRSIRKGQPNSEWKSTISLTDIMYT